MKAWKMTNVVGGVVGDVVDMQLDTWDEVCIDVVANFLIFRIICS